MKLIKMYLDGEERRLVLMMVVVQLDAAAALVSLGSLESGDEGVAEGGTRGGEG